MKKNDIIELKITGMTSEGQGVGRAEDGMAIFVADSAIGDRLLVRIVKVNKKFAYGKLEKIIVESGDRVKVDCPYFTQCGGCTYRHISYDSEKNIKWQKVADSIKHIGKLDNSVEELIGADDILCYRNKCQVPVGENKDGNIIAGFYGINSHRIVDNNHCLLQNDEFSDIINMTKAFMKSTNQHPYNEFTAKGNLRHIYLRKAMATDEIMVCFVVNGNGLKQEAELVNSIIEKYPNVKSVIVNSNREKTNVILGKKNRVAYGRDYIVDELCGKKFRLNPMSFYQVNHHMAQVLYNKAKEYANLSHDDVLLDLYCGTGTIGLTMADSCKKLYGIEIVKEAVENAKENAILNNIDNAEFICGDATKEAEKLKELAPTVIVVDPPRKGLTKELIDTICYMSPNRIVYVSCDSSTLARDLAIFSQKYQVNKITPVDLFPRTPHVETVVLMSRKDK